MTLGELIAIGISLGSLVVAVLAYRHADKVKKLDLLVEAGQLRNKLISDFATLVETHDAALRSRRSVAVAHGTLGGGRMELVEKEWNSDGKMISETIAPGIPSADFDLQSLSRDQLAQEIVEMHGQRTRVTELLEKYRQWGESDRHQLDHYREDQRAASITRRGGPQ